MPSHQERREPLPDWYQFGDGRFNGLFHDGYVPRLNELPLPERGQVIAHRSSTVIEAWAKFVGME